MLEKIDLKKKLTKAEYGRRMEELMPKLGRLQRECQKWKIPVMIAFEDMGHPGRACRSGSDPGLDPRGFQAYAVKNETEEEKNYIRSCGASGQRCRRKAGIAIYDSSWYRKVLIDRFDGKTSEKEVGKTVSGLFGL